jgi:hypothetical protein
MDQPGRATGIVNRPQQPLDESAMHRADITARGVLQHTETIDHDIDAMVPD